ncbi:hypothetical protein H0H81_008316 [Sphagnurus paluster]|uniref:Uncharacterized protein n=1 Tax=Sphagnurus paluster TaxID=117069 RepID=A0A9P7GVX6_9AGAR|nr:hypothetical protein H0H81_008316 [Sphagnurus paluster]
MGWFSDDSSQAQAYNQVTNSTNKASLPHELIAAAASYEAAQAYEKHCAKNGKPPSHAKAKELLCALQSLLLYFLPKHFHAVRALLVHTSTAWQKPRV